jgi:hypothetical protein
VSKSKVDKVKEHTKTCGGPFRLWHWILLLLFFYWVVLEKY